MIFMEEHSISILLNGLASVLIWGMPQRRKDLVIYLSSRKARLGI